MEKAMHIWRNLSRRKLRSTLTIAGISIGIVALVVFGSMANKINTLVSANAAQLDGKVMVTSKGSTERMPQPLSPATVEAVKAVDGVSTAIPSVEMLEEGGMSMAMFANTIVGVSPEANTVPGGYNLAVAQGRALDASDVDSNVTVLGSDIALKTDKHVGDTIEIRGGEFTVVGILETTLAMPDTEILVPLKAAQRMFVAGLPDLYRTGVDPTDVVTELIVTPDPGVDPDELASRIDAATDQVDTMTSADIDKTFGAVAELFTAILVGIALISLLVGGLSIVNTMAMSVAERTREIGIKRAIGGSRQRVVREIVTESAVIGLIGGLVGLALGAVIVVIGNRIGRLSGSGLFDLTVFTAVSSVIFATVLGALAGLIPALNAARLDPVAALRYE
jgi:putative ABC transport system permease protein